MAISGCSRCWYGEIARVSKWISRRLVNSGWQELVQVAGCYSFYKAGTIYGNYGVSVEFPIWSHHTIFVYCKLY